MNGIGLFSLNRDCIWNEILFKGNDLNLRRHVVKLISFESSHLSSG